MKNVFLFAFGAMGWSFLPRRGDYFPKDDCVDCERPREKKNKDGHDGQSRKMKKCDGAVLPISLVWVL